MQSAPGADHNYQIAADDLRQGIERIEQIRAEIADLKRHEREVFAEYKARGYMTRPMRTLLKERATDPARLAEDQAVLELYRAALGTEGHD